MELDYSSSKIEYNKSALVCDSTNASITIYLALMLVLVMALICTIIESGRVNAISSRLKSITFMGVDSVFAEYAQPVFSDYGIMMLWANSQEIKEKFEDYVSNNLNPDEGTITRGLNLYGMKLKESSISDLNNVMDDNAVMLEEQIVEYMELFAVEEVLEKFILQVADVDNADEYLESAKNAENKKDEVLKEIVSGEENSEETYSDSGSSAETGTEGDTEEEVQKASIGEALEAVRFIDVVKGIFSSGVLNYVAEDISEKSVSAAELPSKNVPEAGSLPEDEAEEKAEEKIVGTPISKALIMEYCVTHFGNYLNKKTDTALDYEAEYILFGKDTDRKNLSAAVDRIVLIREAMNMAGLYKDPAKKAQAEALGVAIASLCTVPEAKDAFTILVIAAWALAESYVDVKLMLQGKKVPLIKDMGEWNISLEGLKNYDGNIEGETSGKGLGYEDYLRILLLIRNKTKILYRILDVIEINMQKNENKNFKISECMVGCNICASYTSNILFFSFGFLGNYVNNGNSKYVFDYSREYVY